MFNYRLETRKLLKKYNYRLKESFYYDYSYYQIIGNREKQEDSICCIEDCNGSNLFAVLCDGIGGLEYGDYASSLSVYRMVEKYLQKESDEYIPDFLQNAFISVDKEIYTKEIKMGTTMISIFIKDKKLYFASVGDSALMIWRNKKMYSLVRKHTYGLYLKYLKSENRITYNELLEQSVNSETLIGFIGKGEVSIIDINEHPYQLYRDDIVVLCSDGILNTVDKNVLEQLITNYQSLETKQISNKIFSLIIEKNNKVQDNASLILIKVR